jgi:peptidoglycan/LPS O-acetylase OafA/YrhL
MPRLADILARDQNGFGLVRLLLALASFTIAISAPLAWASWELVERPALGLRCRLRKRHAGEPWFRHRRPA